MTLKTVHVIGGGLAGSEAAWQLAQSSVPVVLHEMRPLRATPVHKTDGFAEPAHFLMQQADRIVVLVVGAEGIRADQLGKAVGLVHRRRAQRPHFVQHDRHAALRELPGSLRAGEAAADDMNGFQGHGGKLAHDPEKWEPVFGKDHAPDQKVQARARQPAKKVKRPRRARAFSVELWNAQLSSGARRSRPAAEYPS